MITLTNNATTHINEFFKNRTGTIGLRVGTKTYGCNGMAYTLEFADKINDEDKVFESNGIKIIVDPKSLLYIDGTVMDYTKEGLNEGFKFSNPNTSNECGCGESFNV